MSPALSFNWSLCETYLENEFSFAISSDVFTMCSPNSSCGLPPLATCLVIALAPARCVNGYLNLSPSSFSMYNDCICLDLAPGTSSSTLPECLIINLVLSKFSYDLFAVPVSPSLTSTPANLVILLSSSCISSVFTVLFVSARF